eukprot:TRINITY_DN11214_c0_g1_i1.p3 TRINITY_DN11214_c0_g1~~TRINITY_DN11214_c0_g1_i1.p3  ORF type:complete len:167 (-),score=43.73 TRINITY_DN11214_c0_g1_i1:630-1130(-)
MSHRPEQLLPTTGVATVDFACVLEVTTDGLLLALVGLAAREVDAGVVVTDDGTHKRAKSEQQSLTKLQASSQKQEPATRVVRQRCRHEFGMSCGRPGVDGGAVLVTVVVVAADVDVTSGAEQFATSNMRFAIIVAFKDEGDVWIDVSLEAAAKMTWLNTKADDDRL